MISREEAYAIVMESVRRLDSERVDLEEALGRILAEDVRSDMNMPPFDKSAMDGYACRRSDLTEPLTVVEVIRAGFPPNRVIGVNQCAQIMTGARIPEGADCVIKVEDTAPVGPDRIRFTGKSTRKNICPEAELMKVDEVVLRQGCRLSAQHIALLATVGKTRPLAARRPRVGIIATGDELIEPDQTPGPSQIRTSNSAQLKAQATQTGAIAKYYGIAPDEEDEIDARFKQAMAENDVVILSGGVSMGDFDLVPDVMQRNGITIHFDSIAIKPGKPTIFGTAPNLWVLGLPGNPVSTFVQFELLVKPLLYKMMGHDYRPLVGLFPLTEDITRRVSDRELWLPVIINDDRTIRPCRYHGSADIRGICEASGLVVLPIGTDTLSAGSLTTVYLI